MSSFSQSPFLQALGWATINSFWQMALLWCGFVTANYLFNFSARLKYVLSTASIFLGFIWFIITFFLFFSGTSSYSFLFSFYSYGAKYHFLPVLLSSASIAYLLILTVPGYRLFSNWQYVKLLRQQELQKANVQYKLFIKRISGLLNIRKNVCVYVSDFVKSPVTIGYLKPIILLPIASINQLTTQQVEAILLHELSHIKRHDYLINILINVFHTLLYFNPFVTLFIRAAEEERENCCDQMVLQFEYNKISYASALLTLEKFSLKTPALAIGAAGKKNLLNRIEKIVGMEKKPTLKMSHFVSLLTAFLFIFVLNAFFVSSKQKTSASLSFNNWVNPFYIYTDEKTEEIPSSEIIKHKGLAKLNPQPEVQEAFIRPETPAFVAEPIPDNLEFLSVLNNAGEENMSSDQKQQVESTVKATKEVLKSTQWKEIEKTIGDDLTETEKIQAKHQYLKEVERIDWKTFEKNLGIQYNEINWNQVNTELTNALALMRLDSLQSNYEHLLEQINKVESSVKCPQNLEIVPFPDESVQELEMRKTEIHQSLNEIKKLRVKKIDL